MAHQTTGFRGADLASALVHDERTSRPSPSNAGVVCPSPAKGSGVVLSESQRPNGRTGLSFPRRGLPPFSSKVCAPCPHFASLRVFLSFLSVAPWS